MKRTRLPMAGRRPADRCLQPLRVREAPHRTCWRVAPASSGFSPTGVVLSVPKDFVTVVDKVRPSVVEITTSTGLGSGVVYDDNGDIATNDQVVRTARSFQVSRFAGNGVVLPDTIQTSAAVNPATAAALSSTPKAGATSASAAPPP
jgi:putative serine protease PepD